MIFERHVAGRKVNAFSLSPNFLAEFEGRQPKWGPVGYFVYMRTYSRPLQEGGQEEFWQTCKRVVEGCYDIQKVYCRRMGLPWSNAKAQGSAQEMYRRMWEFKFTPPGRGLWVMGTDLVYERGSAALQNCSYVSSEGLSEDFAGPFCFLMDMSMLGVGVGGDTKGAGKVRLVRPELGETPFVVEDSREGWVDLARTILNSFVGKNPYPPVIDYSKVRGRGEPIKTFGGVASGPAPLQELVEGVTRLLLPPEVTVDFEVPLDEEKGTIGAAHVFFRGSEDVPPRPITSTLIVDVFNYIGRCVVAGGVRRSSELMLGDPEDKEFRALKQDQEALNDRRWVSNNSIFAQVGMDYSDVASAIGVNGEPGLVWLDNMQAYSRMGDPPDNKDWRVAGVNPCSEISLESAEMCNLAESYPAHHDEYEDFERTLKLAYVYAKTVTLVPTHVPKTNGVMIRNRRLGISMSGIVQAMQKHGRRSFIQWCDEGYAYLRRLDRIYSGWLGINESIKLTTVKPSGTVSLLCQATPGIHFPHSRFYIRHIRVQNTSPLVQACRDAGYKVVDDPYAPDTSVIAFPVKEKHFHKGKAEVTVWEQFINVVDVQAHWADNQISATVTFSKDEVRDLQPCLEAFEDRLKGISMLPLGDADHGYQFPPYQEITEEEYAAMSATLRPIDFSGNVHDKDSEDKFCTGDTCELQLGK